MGLWTRQHDGHNTSDLIHHSESEVQYLAVRYTERLAEAGAVASVGSKGDCDKAMAEAFNSLFKAELVRNRGPWKNIDDLRSPSPSTSTGQLSPPTRQDRPRPDRSSSRSSTEATPSPSSLLSGSWKPPPNPVLDTRG